MFLSGHERRDNSTQVWERPEALLAQEIKSKLVTPTDLLWDLGPVHYLCVQGTKCLVFLGNLKKV